ncbi:MAG: alkyl sulfatase dimerization domain-containing protein [Woeseiaceae bacterium]|nr:alkyl sulfatase dimerization domain-containing protein [Woeseiaceae bacterium]
MASLRLFVLSAASLALAACGGGSSNDANPPAPVSVDDVVAASESTKRRNASVEEYLPFDDTRDFENARRGFIASLATGKVLTADGKVSYDTTQFDFLEGDAPDTVNPSFWRQSKLNAMDGLYEVGEGIYQVRGIDLANMSFIRGETGWIVIDPLTMVEPAQAGLALLREHVEDLPVSAVIITHSHADHFGGVRGVISEQEIEARGVDVVAPEGFFDASVNENLMAGNHMTRRAMYMFGNLLPKSAEGSVGSGLGTTTAVGTLTIIEPTIEITETLTELTVDGVDMVFMNTPGAEAPAELMFYMPDKKAFCQAEIINQTLHNLLTLRGAEVRSGLLWSKYIHQALELFGDEVEISFGSHHWPTWGNEEIIHFWKVQRDTYRYIHDEVLRLANHGYTLHEVGDAVTLPDSLAREFENRDYYGTVNHNAKAQYQLYFGYFTGNPAMLFELPPEQAGVKFVEYMGGADNVIEKAQKDFDTGEYRWAATALNHVVFAEPENMTARRLLANVYTQLGYQSESGPWRNFYLTGAKELREGVQALPVPNTMSGDIVRNLDLEAYLDFLAVSLNHPEAAGRVITLNYVLPDRGEEFVLYIENGVLNYTLGKQADDADATVTIDRQVLDNINLGATTIVDAIQAGDVTVDGDSAKFMEFLGLLDRFDLWFNIVTP